MACAEQSIAEAADAVESSCVLTAWCARCVVLFAASELPWRAVFVLRRPSSLPLLSPAAAIAVSTETTR